MIFRCGYIAIIGRPNVGKSTLLNRLVGEHVAIVTPKPQTTRQRILGIVSRPSAQMIFLDTPGFHQSSKAINRAMLQHVDQAISDADVVCFLFEPELGSVDLELWERMKGRVCIPIINKMDTVAASDVIDLLCRFEKEVGRKPLTLSAKHGTGVEDLLKQLEALLPEGPALYPADIYTDQHVRFLAAELVREQAMLLLKQELPYALAVEIETFKETEKLVRIEAAIIVEKESQKGIVIGAGAQMIKQIGQRARVKIEELVGTKVFLGLKVRVERDWTSDPAVLKRVI